MFWTALRLFLFSFSTIGFIMFIERKTKIQVEFIPIITISLITTVLFFGSLLNLLPFTTLALFLIGAYLFGNIIFKKYKQHKIIKLFSKYMTPGVILLIIASIFFLGIFQNQRLLHYDNFSHWAVIVKNMVIDNRLPNIENPTVTFNSYPPGSALFIYYFMKIVGVSEGFALFAQMLIILSSILTLFSYSSFSIIDMIRFREKPTKKIFISVILIFTSIYLLNGPSSVHNLLVDTLLSVIGIALFSLIYYYFNHPSKIFISVFLLSFFLTLIKNSGIFFSLLALVFYGISLFWRYKKSDKRVVKLIQEKYYLLFPFISPLLANNLWSKHVSLVYPSDSLGKHTMSIDAYIQNFNDKSALEIDQISQVFFDTLSNGYLDKIIFLVFVIILLIILKFVSTKKIDKSLLFTGILDIVVFTLYGLGLWGMYLFSMPTNEAINLAGFWRYMDTIMSFIIGVTAVILANYLSNIKVKRVAIISNVLVLILFGYLTLNEENIEETKSIFMPTNLSIGTTEPNIKNIDASLNQLSKNPLKSDGGEFSYLIYYPKKENTDYENYYIRYRLHHNISSLFKDTKDTQKIWEYDYFTITLVTEEIKSLFNNFSDEDPEIGTYRINKEDKKILKY